VPRNDRCNDKSAAVIGRVLRETREASGLTQQEVAMRADMDRAYISEVEGGKRSLSVDRLLRICESMNLRAAKVIADVEQKLKSKNIPSRGAIPVRSRK
jgi:transcriptional regulator with XRE-family HTH domain